MNMSRAAILTMAITGLSACGSTPNTSGSDAVPIAKSAPVAKSVADVAETAVDVVDTIHNGDDIEDANGLGTIVYNGKPLIECGRQLRTGSRIRRQVCRPDGYNGMFPSGGINVGTAKESQVGYGNH